MFVIILRLILMKYRVTKLGWGSKAKKDKKAKNPDHSTHPKIIIIPKPSHNNTRCN